MSDGRGGVAPAGVALDVDGTLVDSVDAHARAWVAALAQFGMRVAFEDVRPLIGMGGDKLLATVSGISSDSDVGKAISKRRSEIFRETELPELRPMRGAHDLIEALRARGLTLGVATSAKQDELRALLEVVGATWLLGDATDADDVSSTKPDPDVVHAALARMERRQPPPSSSGIHAGTSRPVRAPGCASSGSAAAARATPTSTARSPSTTIPRTSSPTSRRLRSPVAPRRLRPRGASRLGSEEPVADVHRLVGLAAIVVAAASAIWSVIVVVARRDAGRAYLAVLGVVVAAALAAALLGAPLLVAGPGPGDPLHLLYGAIAVVAIPAGIWLAVGRTPRRQSVILFLAVLVELGVTVRLLQTG